MMLACFRGSQAAASALIEATIERGAAGGQAGIVTWARWAAAVLYTAWAVTLTRWWRPGKPARTGN